MGEQRPVWTTDHILPGRMLNHGLLQILEERRSLSKQPHPLLPHRRKRQVPSVDEPGSELYYILLLPSVNTCETTSVHYRQTEHLTRQQSSYCADRGSRSPVHAGSLRSLGQVHHESILRPQPTSHQPHLPGQGRCRRQEISVKRYACALKSPQIHEVATATHDSGIYDILVTLGSDHTAGLINGYKMSS